MKWYFMGITPYISSLDSSCPFEELITCPLSPLLYQDNDEVEVELPWGMRGPREGEVAAFLAAHLATRGLTCLLVVDDLWDR